MEPTGHATDFVVGTSFPDAMARFVRLSQRRWPGLFLCGRPLAADGTAGWRLPESDDAYADILTFSAGQEMEDWWEDNGYALDPSGEGPYAVLYSRHRQPLPQHYTVSLVTPEDPATDGFCDQILEDFLASFRRGPE